MKKFFSTFSLLVMAVASVSFVSCSSDNDVINDIDPKVNPQQSRTTPAAAAEENNYLALKFWASDDLLEIADVTFSGIVADYTFTNDFSITTYTDWVIKGKSGSLVEAPTGKEGKITFTLKENWEEIVKGKEALSLVSAMAQVHEKGAEFKFDKNCIKGILVDVSVAGAEELKMVLEMCNYSVTVK